SPPRGEGGRGGGAMTRPLVERIADAVLYEGYILYPYRPSVKNRQRWTFGGLYPEAYSRAQGGTDACGNQTECLIQGNADTTVEATVRFLHLTARLVGEFVPPLKEWPDGAEPPFRPGRRADILDLALAGKTATVEALEQDYEGRIYLAVTVDDDPGRDLGELRQPGHRFFFSPEEVEPLAPVDQRPGDR